MCGITNNFNNNNNTNALNHVAPPACTNHDLGIIGKIARELTAWISTHQEQLEATVLDAKTAVEDAKIALKKAHLAVKTAHATQETVTNKLQSTAHSDRAIQVLRAVNTQLDKLLIESGSSALSIHSIALTSGANSLPTSSASNSSSSSVTPNLSSLEPSVFTRQDFDEIAKIARELIDELPIQQQKLEAEVSLSTINVKNGKAALEKAEVDLEEAAISRSKTALETAEVGLKEAEKKLKLVEHSGLAIQVLGAVNTQLDKLLSESGSSALSIHSIALIPSNNPFPPPPASSSSLSSATANPSFLGYPPCTSQELTLIAEIAINLAAVLPTHQENLKKAAKDAKINLENAIKILQTADAALQKAEADELRATQKLQLAPRSNHAIQVLSAVNTQLAKLLSESGSSALLINSITFTPGPSPVPPPPASSSSSSSTTQQPSSLPLPKPSAQNSTNSSSASSSPNDKTPSVPLAPSSTSPTPPSSSSSASSTVDDAVPQSSAMLDGDSTESDEDNKLRGRHKTGNAHKKTRVSSIRRTKKKENPTKTNNLIATFLNSNNSHKKTKTDP